MPWSREDLIHHSLGYSGYKVMPFGLKNTGPTYQRAMTVFFYDMMHKETEVYVDNMIAKSTIKEDHLVDLKKLLGQS